MARQAAIRSTYQRSINLGRSFYEILAQAVRSFNEVDAAEGAASMAFFAIFSLFPVLLLLVAVGSFVLQSQEAQHKVFELVKRGFPVSQELIERNVRRVLELRGTVGIVGRISLLWSASALFSTLAYHLNRAWPEVTMPSFIKSPIGGYRDGRWPGRASRSLAGYDCRAAYFVKILPVLGKDILYRDSILEALIGPGPPRF
jgi:hypothetical protein